MLFDTRQIVTDGVYGFGDPFEVFDDRNGEVVLAFQSPSITNLSDGLPVTFGAVSGSVSPTSFSTSDGGTLAGTFIATIEGEREIDDDSDNDVTLTGTISGSFNLEIQ